MMAFTTERDGNQEIYVIQSDGSGPVNLTNAPSQELSPDWQSIVSSPLDGQAPSAGRPAVGDRTAPRLRLRVRSRQRVLRRRAVLVSVACNEPCFATASGTIRVSRKRRTLEPVRRELAVGVRRTLRLHLSRTTRRSIRRALQHGRKVKATISVAAQDIQGNASSKRRLVRLTG
jgi:hypothetical protein